MAAPAISATPGGTVSAASVARTFNVNSSGDTSDANAGNGKCADSANKCTLRAAIEEANADSGVTDINIPAGMTIKVGSALEPTHSVNITGGGSTTIIDGQHSTQVFYIDDSTTNPAVSITGLTIQNGDNGTSDGGNIYSDYAALTLSNVVIKGGSAGYGGGVYSDFDNALWLVNSTVLDNKATYGGAGLYLDGSAYSSGSSIAANDVGDSSNDGYGGGIYIDSGRVVLENDTISRNLSTYAAAGIYNDETLQMTGGSIDHNMTDATPVGEDAYAAALYADYGSYGSSTSLNGVAITANSLKTDYYPEGGAIYNDGAMSLVNTTISGTKVLGGNDEDMYGGAIENSGEQFSMQGGSISGTTVTMKTGTTTGGYVYGGVIYSDALTTLHGVAISGTTTNNAGSGYDTYGGIFYQYHNGLDVSSTTISSTTNTADTVEGGVAYLDGNATLSGLSIKSTTNHFGAYLEGGAIYNENGLVHIDNVTVDGTTSTSPASADGGAYGGAISMDGEGATVTSTTVTNTTVGDSGPKSYIEGGAIYNDYPATFDRVQALNTNVATDDEVFGGVFSDDGDNTNITNSTFADAHVTVAGYHLATHKYLGGGAVYLGYSDSYAPNLVNVTIANVTSKVPSVPGYDTSTVNVDSSSMFTNVTMANNTISGAKSAAMMHSGVFLDSSDITASFKNTIVSNSPVSHECGVDSTGMASQLISTGNNLENGTWCGFTNAGDQQNTGPMVAPIADNGGPVQTAALMTGSPAINAGTNAGCPATDARGVPRPVGSACDVGAYEYNLQGYWFTASDGGVFTFGPGATYHGSLGGVPLASPIVGMASDPVTGGYWLVAADGGVFAFDAPYYGSMGGKPLAQPIVGMAAAPGGHGYWLVAKDGGIFTFGPGAHFYGSMGGTPLAQPVVGIAADPVTGGYWMVASDGGMFSFHAPFFGSTGGTPLAQPVVGMAPAPFGQGYWLVAKDGGIFSFGPTARFWGSTGGIKLAQPIVGMAPDYVTGGYWMVASDGGIFSFHAPFYGSTGGIPLAKPIVSMAAASVG